MSQNQRTSATRPRAVVLGVQLPGVSDEEHDSSLAELSRLGKTLGVDVVARVTQRRAKLDGGSVVGEGKLRELAALTGGSGVVPTGPPRRRGKPKAEDGEPEESAEAATPAEAEKDATPAAARAGVVLVDHDLSPSQARNLERATSAEVLDRSAVILAIFQRHARSREARLQVEIARLSYWAPRVRESGGGKDRQGGGIGGRGAGESQLELDRRKLRDRIAELRAEIASIEREAGVRRQRREEQNKVALVGYTNAGKSSLMRALTGSGVMVADRLFATLDTTVRALQPETTPRILVSDTVGFIKKLPHELVASFRSTLDEARDAELLLHVVDAADPAFPAQIEVTRAVLADIGAEDVPRLLLLNKIDRVDAARAEALRAEHPDALLLSAKRPEDVARLRERIRGYFERDMVEEEITVPYARQRLVAEIHASCRVLEEAHDERGTRLRLRARPAVLARLRAAV
ncbi:MAG TPA: GTPase HflX [Myxococcota bacterium]|jgi:GTP-binding protein HflX